jgi:hypothetical protein
MNRFDSSCLVLCGAYLKKVSMLKDRRQQKSAAQPSVTSVCGSPAPVFGKTRSLNKKGCLTYHDQLDLMIPTV